MPALLAAMFGTAAGQPVPVPTVPAIPTAASQVHSPDIALLPPANGMRRLDVSWVALRNCTVYVKPGAEAMQAATILVRDGIIIAVLPGEAVAAGDAPAGEGEAAKPRYKASRVPIGPRVIDGTGLHVYAGFIDACVEVEAPAPRGDKSQLHWNTKVTPQRSALDGGGIDEATATALRKLGFAAAAIAPKGGVFRGRAALVSLAKPSDDPSVAKPEVYRDNVYQFIAMETSTGGRGNAAMWGSYPDSQMGAIALIRQTFLDGQWWSQERERGTGVLGVAALDYVAPQAKASASAENVRSATQVYLLNTESELDVYRARKVADEFGLTYMLLGSGLEYRRLSGVRAEPTSTSKPDSPVTKDTKQDNLDPPQSVQLVLPLNFAKAPDVSSVAKQEATDLREMMAWEQAPTNPRRLHDAGVRFALTTSKLKDRGDFAKNLRSAVRHGLSADAALASLTTTPAAWLGATERLGTIEAGKAANLTVLDGPLFGKTSEGKLSKVRGVWIEGKWQEVIAAPVVCEGIWDVTIPADKRPVVRRLEIDRDNGVTVIRDDKRVKATQVVAEEGRLTFTFDHDALDGEEGICTMAAVVQTAGEPSTKLDGVAAPSRMIGIGVSGTGKRYDWIATKRPASLAGVWPIFLDESKEFMGSLIITDDAEHSMIGLAGQPAAAVKNFIHSGSTLTFDIDRGGGAADSVRARTSSNMPGEKRGGQLKGVWRDASAKETPWTALRREPNPFIGSWRVTELDGKAPAEDAAVLTMKVAPKAVTLTFTKGEDKPIVIEANDVRFRLGLSTARGKSKSAAAAARGENQGDKDPAKSDEVVPNNNEADAEELKNENQDTVPEEAAAPPDADGKPVPAPAAVPQVTAPGQFSLRFTHDLAKLGGKGKSSDRVIAEFSPAGPQADVLVGQGTLPDGSVHEYKASRLPPDGAANSETSDDEEPISKDIPEKIGVPFGAYGLTAYPEPAAHTIISNATIWTCDALGKVNTIERGYVYLRGNKIAMVGSGDPSVSVPQGERSVYIDAKGKHITPGIVDCHSHTGISGGVNEGGQAVTAECRIADVTNPDSVSWYQQLAGGVTAVLSLHGSANSIGGQSQTNKIRWGTPSPDDMHFEGAAPGIKFALGENPRRANGRGEGEAGRYPATRMGVEMQIRDRFTAAKEYNAARNLDNRTRRDLELEALSEVLRGERLVHAHSYRQDEMVMLALVAREFGFKIGTYQHALEGYKVADYVRDYSGGASGFSDWWAYKVEVQDAIPQAFSIMHEQGVVVSLNSDSNELARRLNVEAAKAVKYSGTDPIDALKFVTLFPAKQLKIDSRVGSIEAGKDADIAIWSGPPLSSLSRCEATYVDGRLLFSIENDRLLREETTAQRLRLLQKLLSEKKRKDKSKSSGDGGQLSSPAKDAKPPVDAASDTRATSIEEAQRAEIKRLFIQMHNSGVMPQQQGDCGCGVVHLMHD